MRVILAGLAGAVAMFIWTSIAHVMTPLGSTGFSQIPNEQPVLDAMHTAMGDKPGLYFYPWVDPNDPNAMAISAQKTKTNPSGLLIYHPPGPVKSMGPMLVEEFLKEFGTALIAAFLLSMTAIGGYLMRVGFVSLIGVAAGATTNLSYWIWYEFPTSYTLAYMTVDIVSYVAAGLAIAAVLRPKA